MPNLVVILILIISIISDLRNRKILNIVTFPAILTALIYHFFTSGLEGFLFSGQGLLIGIGLLFIPFIMGGIGAGDVKLLAAVGAWQGSLFIFYTGIYAGLIGGLIAVYILLKRREAIVTLKRMLFSVVLLRSAKGSLQFKDEVNSSFTIPYAIPIALGALLTFLMELNQ